MSLNFVAGGRMGDFIHALYVVKNLCEREKTKASIRLVDGGDAWKHGLRRAYDDCWSIVLEQPYVESLRLFEFLDQEPVTDLTAWRKGFSYGKCWSQFFSEFYGIKQSQYKWMETGRTDLRTKGRVAIHRTLYRQNAEFPWEKILSAIPDEIVFVTSDKEEWEGFPFKRPNMSLVLAPTITEMAIAISSSRLFIGTQSCPMALACAFDVSRLIELDYWVCQNSMGEVAYSDNVSWFLNPLTQYLSHRLPAPVFEAMR